MLLINQQQVLLLLRIYRTSWAVKRVGVQTNGDSGPNVTGNPAVINDDEVIFF